MAGRPTKYTPERRERVIAALKGGNTRRAACAYAGITEDTLANWLGRYSDFSDQVTAAEASVEVRNVALVLKAGEKDWRAALEWLARRRPNDWGKIERQEVRHVDKAGEDAQPSRILLVNAPAPPPDT